MYFRRKKSIQSHILSLVVQELMNVSKANIKQMCISKKVKKHTNITNRPRKKVGVNKQFAQVIIFAQDKIIYNMLKMK